MDTFEDELTEHCTAEFSAPCCQVLSGTARGRGGGAVRDFGVLSDVWSLGAFPRAEFMGDVDGEKEEEESQESEPEPDPDALSDSEADDSEQPETSPDPDDEPEVS